MKETRNTRNSSYHRTLILSFIGEKGPKTISQLAEKLDVTRPTIYGHLDTLEKRKLITRDKDTEKKGSPVTINITDKASPVSLSALEIAKKTWDKVTNL